MTDRNKWGVIKRMQNNDSSQEQSPQTPVYRSSSKRIAKNTLMLYFRQILIMLVSLYTVRVILNTLGAVDYGIYNVVAGVVTMFSFLSGAMATASQRYFAFEMGRGDEEALKKTFSVTVIVYAILAIIIVLLAETVGLWFINYKLVIPQERIHAARWIYQFSVMTCAVSVMTTPYLSLILSREKMEIYAWMSILEAVMKLLIVYLLNIISYDKLFVYGILLLAVTILNTTVYKIYCRRNFAESRFSFYWNSRTLKEMISFTGWFFFSMFSGTIQAQAVSVLCNIFFGPAVNAAQGIAVKIRSVSDTFANNFSTASRPQIIKNYASYNYRKMFELLYRTCKTTYYLTLIIVVSVIADIDTILRIWLVNVPLHTVNFARLLMIESLVSSVAFAMSSANQATGKVKWYCLTLGSTAIISIPFLYLFLKMGYSPEIIYIVTVLTQVVLTIIRTLFLKNIPGFSFKEVINKVYVPILKVTVPAAVIAWFLKFASETTVFLFLGITVRFIMIIAIIYFIGFSRSERIFILQIFKSIFRRRKNEQNYRAS